MTLLSILSMLADKRTQVCATPTQSIERKAARAA
jgi:hypothetical protein